MTQKRITKHVEFAAAHSIKDAGKCSNKHGHNWACTITVDQVSGDLDHRGFIVDVRDLKQAAYKYDHDDLDNYFEYPSTENVAQQIAEDALAVCKDSNSEGTYIINVHLVETTHNSADASVSNFVAALSEPTQKANFDALKKKALDQEAAYEAGFQPKAKFVKRAK